MSEKSSIWHTWIELADGTFIQFSDATEFKVREEFIADEGTGEPYNRYYADVKYADGYDEKGTTLYATAPLSNHGYAKAEGAKKAIRELIVKMDNACFKA